MNRRTFVKGALLTTGATLLPITLTTPARASTLRRRVVRSFRPVSALGPAWSTIMRAHPEFRYVIPIGAEHLHYARNWSQLSARHVNTAMLRAGQIQRCYLALAQRLPTNPELSDALVRLARTSPTRPQRFSMAWSAAHAQSWSAQGTTSSSVTIDNPEMGFFGGPEAQAVVAQLEAQGYDEATALAVTEGIGAALGLVGIGTELTVFGLGMIAEGLAAGTITATIGTIAAGAPSAGAVTATTLGAGIAVSLTGLGMIALAGMLGFIVLVYLNPPPVAATPKPNEPDPSASSPPPAEPTPEPVDAPPPGMVPTQDVTITVAPNQNEPEATTPPDEPDAPAPDAPDAPDGPSGDAPGDGPGDGGDGGGDGGGDE
jgi:hypothetical protein